MVKSYYDELEYLNEFIVCAEEYEDRSEVLFEQLKQLKDAKEKYSKSFVSDSIESPEFIKNYDDVTSKYLVLENSLSTFVDEYRVKIYNRREVSSLFHMISHGTSIDGVNSAVLYTRIPESYLNTLYRLEKERSRISFYLDEEERSTVYDLVDIVSYYD